MLVIVGCLVCEQQDQLVTTEICTQSFWAAGVGAVLEEPFFKQIYSCANSVYIIMYLVISFEPIGYRGYTREPVSTIFESNIGRSIMCGK